MERGAVKLQTILIFLLNLTYKEIIIIKSYFRNPLALFLFHKKFIRGNYLDWHLNCHERLCSTKWKEIYCNFTEYWRKEDIAKEILQSQTCYSSSVTFRILINRTLRSWIGLMYHIHLRHYRTTGAFYLWNEKAAEIRNKLPSQLNKICKSRSQISLKSRQFIAGIYRSWNNFYLSINKDPFKRVFWLRSTLVNLNLIQLSGKPE